MASIWPNLIKVPPISSIASLKRLGVGRFGPGSLRARRGHLASRRWRACRTTWRIMTTKMSLNRHRLALGLICPPLKDFSKKDRPAPGPHVINGLLHFCPHLAAEGLYYSAILRCFSRIWTHADG